MKKILILNGPNLNLLGNRETDIYGKHSLNDIKKMCEEKCNLLKLECSFIQSNNEGDLISLIQSVENDFDGLIINPAALTHTSVALLDSIRAISKPKIEVHLSNIYSREEFRRISLLAPIALGVIAGLKFKGYEYALDYLTLYLNQEGLE